MAGAAAEPGGTDRARQLQRSCGNRGLVAGRPKPISTHGTMTMRDHQRERGPQPQQKRGTYAHKSWQVYEEWGAVPVGRSPHEGDGAGTLGPA
jgi:hypothetical protein